MVKEGVALFLRNARALRGFWVSFRAVVLFNGSFIEKRNYHGAEGDWNRGMVD